jgi:hypothetical protein
LFPGGEACARIEVFQQRRRGVKSLAERFEGDVC